MRPLEPMTFEQMRDGAAEDLREFSRIASACADEVAKGDMDAFWRFVGEDMSKSQEMLVLRQSVRAERRELGEQTATDG